MRSALATRVACAVALLGLAGAAACGSPPAHSKPIAAAPTKAATPATPAPPGTDPGEPTDPPGPPNPSTSPKDTPRPSTSPSTRGRRNGRGPDGSQRTTGSSAVALTFDDGPDPVNTPPLLDLLKKYNVKATFCLVGFRARDYPAIVARIAAEGHTLCNHTWQHLQDFSKRDDSYVRWDLKSTNDAILAAAPGAKIAYFRAPYGNFNPRLDGFAAELNLKPIYWDVDDECWRTDKFGVGPAMSEHIRYEVQTHTRPGSIILSHDNKKPWTAATYGTLLPWLQQHFQLIALPT
jgi:peptidoglycan/xylan/chitin deacetylase (PgdA/CDA1 family)